MKIKQMRMGEWIKICKNGEPVIVRTVGVSIHEPKEKKEMSDKITKFLQVMLFEAKKVKDEFGRVKLEQGNALASLMLGKDVPVFSLKKSEIEEMRKTGTSQRFGDKMDESSCVSAVIIGDEILFCSPMGKVSCLELYADVKSSAAKLGSIKSDKKAKSSSVDDE